MKNGSDIGPAGARETPTGRDEALEEEARRRFLFSLSDSFSERDATELRVWREQSAHHDAAFREAVALWEDSAALRDTFASPVARHGAGHKALQGSFASPRRAVAGIMFAACLALFAIFFAADIRIWMMADFRTVDGEIAPFTFPDGSRAILNTDSAITFNFTEKRREIAVLRGEAIFEVRKDPARPFTVEALEGTATAIGTVFVVRANADEAIVTVSEGKVAVAAQGVTAAESAVGDVVLLGSAERTTYHHGARPAPVTQVRPEAIAPWRRNTILIDGLPFVEAVAELNRYRHGKILVAADTSRLQPVTARFSVSDVEGAVDALAATHGLRVERFTSYLTVIH